MIKILIAIPTYDRRIDIEIVKCILGLERLGKYHLDFIFPISSHISRNRNYACHCLLKGDYDWLLFWDSDIGIEDREFIDRMLETGFKFGADIICGAYKMKEPPLENAKYVIGRKKEDGTFENLKEIKEPQLIDAGGTGIMIIQRKVIETLDEPWFTIIDGKNLFVMPEDFEFCRKAKEKGFKIAVDPRFNTYHYGTLAWIHNYN